MGSFLADFKKGAYIAVFFIFSFLTRGDPIRICAERISEVRVGGGGGVHPVYSCFTLRLKGDRCGCFADYKRL